MVVILIGMKNLIPEVARFRPSFSTAQNGVLFPSRPLAIAVRGGESSQSFSNLLDIYSFSKVPNLAVQNIIHAKELSPWKLTCSRQKCD